MAAARKRHTNKQRGIGTPHAIVIIAVIGILIGSMYAVLSRIQHANKPDRVAKSTQQPISEPSVASEKSDDTSGKPTMATVKNVNVRLIKTTDTSKLPSEAPESFKQLMAATLDKQPIDGCYQQITITKLSPFNVKGSLTLVDDMGKTTNSCSGTTPKLWVLNPEGQWDISGSRTTCASQGGGLVYEEFVAQCYPDDDPTSQQIKNPNGSVTKVPLDS